MGIFVLLATVLVVAILRLGGLITWPGRTAATLALALMLAPIALLLLVAMATDSEGEAESVWEWVIKLFLPRL